MNRRSFLGTLGLTAAALVLDPERLLWVPGQKTIFLPTPELRRLTIDQIAGIALDELRQRLADLIDAEGQRLINRLGPYAGWSGGAIGIGIPAPEPGETATTYCPKLRDPLRNVAMRLAQTGTLGVSQVIVTEDYFPAPDDSLLHLSAIRGQEDPYVRSRRHGIGRDRADRAPRLRPTAAAQDGQGARRHRA